MLMFWKVTELFKFYHPKTFILENKDPALPLDKLPGRKAHMKNKSFQMAKLETNKSCHKFKEFPLVFP